MTRFAPVLLLATSGLIALSSAAAQAAPTSVRCSAKANVVQAEIDKAEAGVVTTINVSGTCTENIAVPRGKTIILLGTLAKTKIIPKDASLPVVSSHGDTTIQNITLQNASGIADSLVQADRGGMLQLIGVDLSAPKVESVVGIWDNATGIIVNSRIGSGFADGVDLANGASLWLGANPARASGPEGAKTAIAGGLFCGPGSNLHLRVKNANGKDGTVSITGGQWAAIGANQCDMNIQNQTASVNNLTITSSNGPGINLSHSTLQLQAAKVTNNKDVGIDAVQSSADFSGSTFSGNAGGDLRSGPGSSIFNSGWGAKNTMPDAFNGESLYCWPSGGGDHIVISSDGMNIPPGKTIGDLAENNPCVTLN